MSSTLHPFVRNLVIVPSRRFVATIATIATFAVGSLRAQQYDSMAGPDDPFDVQTPSVDEYITVGGFQLRVDRTKWDINLGPGNRGLLGRLEGNDVAISIREIARPKSTTVTEKASLETNSVQIERVFTSHAIGGLKVVYRGKTSLISQRIKAIRFLFVNPEGKTICFEARARTPHPDWSDANDLVLNTLSLAKRGGR